MKKVLLHLVNVLPIFVFFLSISEGFSTTEKYRLSLRDDPSSTIVIGWNQVSGSNATVYYGTTDHGTNTGLYSNTKAVDRSTTYKGMNNRFARLTGLSPNTVYYFVVADADGPSARMSFRTLPNVPTDKLSIIAGGDSRNNRTPRQNANLLVAKLRPHAVMFGGDYTSGNSNSEWDEWFDDWQYTIASDGRMTQLIATRGNHESSNDDVYNLFDVPSSDVYYALTLGGSLLRVYTLNTEMSISGNQTTWLTNDLTTNQATTTWKFAQYHKPMRPHTSSKSEGNTQYSSWAGLFNTYNVKLVVECDAHTVKTTWPVVPSSASGSDEGFIRDDINGTVYVGEGCWGAPTRSNNDDKAWTRNSGEFNHVNWIHVDQNNVEARKIKVDNAPQVGSNTDATRFNSPSNIDIWNPSNGSVVTIGAVSNNIIPTVSLTSPASGTIYPSPQQISISANATDSDGTISTVEFFHNGTSIGSDNSAPYSINWTIPANGSYALTAKATDNDGGVAYSGAVNISSGSNFTFSKRIANGDDDVEEEDDGTMYSNSSDLELVADGSRGNQTIGLRYTGVTIPQGATINNAYIQFTCDETNSGSTSLTIRGEDEDNAASYASSNDDVTNRTQTTASVSWNPPAWNSVGASGSDEQTPSLTSILSEIVNRPGWTSGNSMSFMISGTGERTAEAYEGTSSSAAQLVVDYSLAVTNPNVLPTINITSPANNAVYATLASINISANAADSDGTVSKVDFFYNGTLIGSDNSAPYSINWTIPAFGSYTLTAEAVDNDGGVSSDAIQISAAGNVPPAVSITSPANGTNYTSLTSINIAASATDADGVLAVTFYRDGILLGVDNTSPYDINWTIPAFGTYIITAEAEDMLGATSTASIQITAATVPNVPPTASITSPNDGDSYPTPQQIVISANAADSDGTVASVEFYQNNVLIGSVSNAPYSTNWTIPSIGAYQLSVRAIDNDGDDVYSAPITISCGASYTFSKRISSGDDDVEEGVNGSVYDNSSDLELVYDSYNSQGDQTVGLRFTNVTIPNGAIITNAYIQFTADETSSGSTSLSIFGDDTDNSAAFTTANSNVSSRSSTSASVAWAPAAWNTVGQSGSAQQTPDLSSVVSEIVSRSGWTSGNAMTLMVTGTGERTAESYNGSSSSAPELVIEYGPAPPNVLPTVALTTPIDGTVYTSLASIAISANASDFDGSVSQVNFYQNGNLIGTDNSSPYALNWTIPAFGAFTITAEAIDNDGGSSTDVSQITAQVPNQAPFAVISGIPASGVAQLVVNGDASLSYDTDGNIASYAWDFGDGNTSNVSNPTHVYFSQGTYVVTLTVTDNGGLTNAVSTVLTVLPANVLPTSTFTSSSISGQAPHPVTFDGSGSIDSDGSIVDYAWDFGDGTTTNGPIGTHATQSHTYTAGGSFTAQLIVTDNSGATASFTQVMTISAPNVLPTSTFTVSSTSGQAPHSISFDGSGSADSDGSIVDYAWDFGDGTTTNGPVGTHSTQSHTYTAGGSFTAQLIVTDNSGATASFTQVMTISAPNVLPTSTFTVSSTSGQAPHLISFDGSGSADSDGSIVDYAWDFGDGTTTNGPVGTHSTQSHTYTAGGSFTAQLIVTDNSGATTSFSQVITISAPNVLPTSSFTASSNSGQAPHSISFNGNGSADSDGSIIDYAWDFGDGTTTNGPAGTHITQSHTYTTGGSFTATLVVTDNSGGSASYSQVMTISSANISPTAVIATSSPINGQAPHSVTFMGNTSSDPDGTISSYSWDFGDGNSSSTAVSTHVYNAGVTGNTYTAILTVTDNQGATGTASVVINVSAPNVAPVALLSSNVITGYAPLAVNFDASTSYDPDNGAAANNGISSYLWDFGDGNSSIATNPTYVYFSQGTYVITLTVTDSQGLTNAVSSVITVSPANVLPTPSYSASSISGQAPHPITFDGTGSVDSDGSITDYAWDFGDGTTTNGPAGTHETQVHTYTAGGSFTATLTVTDNLGGAASYSQIITIAAPNLSPNAVIVSSTPVNGQSPHSVTLMGNTSSDPDGSIASYAWDFGDGNLSSSAIATHVYTAGISGDTYTAVLTVTDNQGAIGTSSIVISISAPNVAPVALFSSDVTSGFAPLAVNFDASASYDPDNGAAADNGIFDYLWDFGDGNFGSGKTPAHSYSNVGTFTVTLTTTDTQGLSNSTAANINVTAAPSGVPIEFGKATAVGDSWVTVSVGGTYTSMVVVATPVYYNGTVDPVVTRIKNITSSSFDLKVQNPGGSTSDIYDVEYIVVEEGVYTIANDGIDMEAQTINSTSTAGKGNWVREVNAYSQAYTTPVVLGQVMSENDTEWSVFWASSYNSRVNVPTYSASGFAAGKHIAEDTDLNRNNETLGVIIIESGSGILNGMYYEVGHTTDIVGGTVLGTAYEYSIGVNATHAVASMSAMDGGDGGWPVFRSVSGSSGSTLKMSIDEDQISNTERNHTNEQVAYFAVGSATAKTQENSITFDVPNRGEVVSKLYPNPTRESFVVEFDENVGDFIDISIIDMMGRTYLANNNVAMSDRTSVEIVVDDLPAGQYYVLIRVNGDLIRQPLTVVN